MTRNQGVDRGGYISFIYSTRHKESTTSQQLERRNHGIITPWERPTFVEVEIIRTYSRIDLPTTPSPPSPTTTTVGKKTLLLYYIWMGEYWNHRSDQRRQHSYGNCRSVMRRQHSRSDYYYHSSMDSTSAHQLGPIDQQQSALILWLDRGSNNQLICPSGSTTIHSGSVRVLHLDLSWFNFGKSAIYISGSSTPRPLAWQRVYLSAIPWKQDCV